MEVRGLDRIVSHSQNFLHSKKLVSKIVSLSNIVQDDTVIEIGPGKGIITYELGQRCSDVIAIEYDKSLYDKLSIRFKETGNIKIVNMDFMLYKLPNKPYKVFSNIPFNMTADIIQKILDVDEKLTDAYLIIQYEAALKYIGTPYYADCFRSLYYKPLFEAEIIYEFEPTDFSPPPKARIVLVHFHKKEYSDVKTESYSKYRDFLSYVFYGAGRTFKEKTKQVFSYEQQKRIRKASGIEFDSTISYWTYPQWIAMFNCYDKLVSKEKQALVNGAYSKMLQSQKSIKKEHRNRKRINNNGKKT